MRIGKNFLRKLRNLRVIRKKNRKYSYIKQMKKGVLFYEKEIVQISKR